MQLSPSALSVYLSCPRKAFFRHVLRLPEPLRPGAELGGEVHVFAERYITTGTLPDDQSKAVQIVRALVPHLPRLDRRQVETEGSIPRQGLRLVLRVDHWMLPEAEGEPFRVTDIKTTSDFKWAKAQEELKYDPQSIVYSQWAMQRLVVLKWPAYVRFTLLYVRTAAPHYVQTVHYDWTPETLKPQWDYLCGVMQAFEATMTLAVEDTPFNTQACGMYRGCPHRARCAAMGVNTDIF